MPDSSVSTIMNKMQGAFVAENAKGIDASCTIRYFWRKWRKMDSNYSKTSNAR